MYLQIRLFVYLQQMKQRRGAGFKMATTQAMCNRICGTFDHRNRLYLLFILSFIYFIFLYFAIFSLYCSCSRWRSAEEGNPWDGFYLLLAESSVDKVAAVSF